MKMDIILKHMRHIDRVLFRIENDTFYNIFPKYDNVEGDNKRSMSRPP